MPQSISVSWPYRIPWDTVWTPRREWTGSLMILAQFHRFEVAERSKINLVRYDPLHSSCVYSPWLVLESRDSTLLSRRKYTWSSLIACCSVGEGRTAVIFIRTFSLRLFCVYSQAGTAKPSLEWAFGNYWRREKKNSHHSGNDIHKEKKGCEENWIE